MPQYACKRSNAQERALGVWDATNAACASLSFLCESPLWGNLKAAFAARGYEVVSVPYDWRLTPDDAQREYLANAIEREVLSSGQPVDIVAHSMGGIVSLTFLASLANDSRLSGYVDRLVMLGTPVAGSVNAYGLMEVADPLGMEGVALSSQGMYSSVARYLWDASRQSGRSPLYKCIKRSLTFSCIQHDYDTGNTQFDRQTAFGEQAPSGWFLYPNRAYLPFAGKVATAVAHAPARAKLFFNNFDSPNSLAAASSHAECRSSAIVSTSVNSARKTNVNLFLSNTSGSTLTSVETRGYAPLVVSINDVAVPNWSRVQPYSTFGDGTVPVGGQAKALAAFLGTTEVTLSAPVSNQYFPCLMIASAGEHADLTKSQSAIAYALNRLPYPGAVVAATAAKSAEPVTQKAAQATSPQLTVTMEGTADLVVRDPALASVGRTAAGGVALDSAFGSTSATTLSSANRLSVVVTNPSVGSSTVQLAAQNNAGVSLQPMSVRYVDASSQIASAEMRFLLRPYKSVDVIVALQANAGGSTIVASGPSGIGNFQALPGPTATQLTWSQPVTSPNPVVGYHVYASRSQDDDWALVGTVTASTTAYVAPFPAASAVQREISFVVVGVDAQDRYSEVQEFASNRVRNDVESSFGTGRGNPATPVLSPIVPMPNNVSISASVAGGEASVNGGAWQTSGLLIPPFSNVQLRGVASATASQWTTVTLNGPTSASSFSILAAPPAFCRRPTRAVVQSGAFIRYLDGVSGTPLMQGLYPAAEVSSTAATALTTHFDDNLDAYDFNGEGGPSVGVDGLLYARYALGFRGASLVAGLAVGTTRTTAQIEAALAGCQ